jgi:hypothetical protein
MQKPSSSRVALVSAFIALAWLVPPAGSTRASEPIVYLLW